MKEHERLAKIYSLDQLREMSKSCGIAIDSASGRELANARKRYWTIEKAMDLKRKEGE